MSKSELQGKNGSQTPDLFPQFENMEDMAAEVSQVPWHLFTAAESHLHIWLPQFFSLIMPQK